MSLFGDLPPPEKLNASENDRSERRKKVEEEKDTKKVKSALHPVIKHSNESIQKDTDSKDKKSVRFKTSEDLDDSQVESAILKISTHIGNSSKFNKASKLAIQLLESGSVTPCKSDNFFIILKKAMSDPTSSNNASVRNDYKILFDTVKQHLNLFSHDQQNQISVWLIWADLANSLFTDDTYEFARVASQIRQYVESLPEATEEDEMDDMNPFKNSNIVQDSNSPAAASNSHEEKMKQSNTNQLDSSNQTSNTNQVYEDQVNSSLDQREDKDNVKNDETSMENDPFGLGNLISRKMLKKEEKLKRKREEENAIKHDVEESKRLLREKREALLRCLQISAERYKLPWAQTMIDIMAKHAFDHRSRFIRHQRHAIESLWNSVRDQQMRRKHGKSASGKLDITAFERLQQQYANEKISIRKGVGGSAGRGSITWLG